MKLGMQVGLGPGHNVFDDDPAPLPQRGTAPNFRHISIVDKQLNVSRCHLLGMEVGLSPGDFMLDGDRPLSKKGPEAPIFGPCLLWPNGWMDQDGTWHGGRLQSRRLCVRRAPSPLLKKRAEPPHLWAQFLLWPNGWMHQDTTWYGSRP